MGEHYIIYGYQCLLDKERWYIGQTLKRESKRRHKRHKKAKSNAKKFNAYLAKRYREKYVYSQVFKRYILCEFIAEDINTVERIEHSFIDKYDSINKGFNIEKTGCGGAHSEETRRKISESKKGENNPAKRPEVRKKMSESQKGNTNASGKRSEETCRRIGESKRNPSKETRKKMSESHKGKIPGNAGEKVLRNKAAEKNTLIFNFNFNN